MEVRFSQHNVVADHSFEYYVLFSSVDFIVIVIVAFVLLFLSCCVVIKHCCVVLVNDIATLHKFHY